MIVAHNAKPKCDKGRPILIREVYINVGWFESPIPFNKNQISFMINHFKKLYIYIHIGAFVNQLMNFFPLYLKLINIFKLGMSFFFFFSVFFFNVFKHGHQLWMLHQRKINGLIYKENWFVICQNMEIVKSLCSFKYILKRK